ncbi:MAG: FIST C-terminal domain-containing protein [Nitrospirae bacterium]|nr:FIST C-terminal domain-containing protein [Nitrospirota bacterium]
MRFSSAVSRDPGAARAGLAIGRAARCGLGDQPADLAFLFFSAHYANHAETLCRAVRKELDPRQLVGCTGEGVISNEEEIEATSAVTLWAARLPGVQLTPLRLSVEQDGEKMTMTGWPDRFGAGPERLTFLLLADPYSTPVDEVLSLMADRCPGSSAIGGMAGGGHDVGENRMILNDAVYDGGLVGVAVFGPVSIRTVVSQGCRPIGERYVVTKAERNVIHELGGSQALERLQTAFESLSGEERRHAHRALHIGIVIDEQRNRFERGDFLVRNLIGADRESGSVAIGDMVKEGQTVQFHLRDAQSASEDLHLLLAADRARHKQPPLGALIFSCCGRGRGLFGRPHHDVTVIRERAGEIPVAGFFAQGEIGPVGGSNFLHGYTASVALFSEPGS